MPDLLAEVRNFSLFLKAVLEVGLFTGLIVIPVVLLGYEWRKKRAL